MKSVLVALVMASTLLSYVSPARADSWDKAFKNTDFPDDSDLKGGIIVAAAGEASSSKPAADALEGFLRGSGKFSLVMNAVGLGDISGLDDAAIVKKCAVYKVDYVALVRVFGKGPAANAVVTFYSAKGDTVTALHARLGETDSTDKTVAHGVTSTTVDAVRDVIGNAQEAEIELTPTRFATEDSQAACSYVPEDDNWMCDATELTRIPVPKKGQRITSGNVKFRTNSSGCIKRVSIQLSHPDRDLQVDWRSVTFVYQSQAIQTQPAWYAAKDEGTHGFVMSAPAGSSMRETIVAQDLECLRPLWLAEGKKRDELKVVVPFLADGTSQKAELLLVREIGKRTEKQVMAAIPRPVVPTQPDPVSLFIPYASIGGGVVGFGGIIFMLVYSNSLASVANNPVFTLGVCGIGTAACLVPALVVGLVFDLGRGMIHYKDEKRYERWQQKFNKQQAYDRKLKQLGITQNTKGQ